VRTCSSPAVANLADLDRLYAIVKKEKGHLDIVFATAGFGEFGALGTITEEHFDKTFDVNVKGLLFTVQKALLLLKDGGNIILNASIVSVKGMPALSVYSATKAAVRSFPRGWSVDLKDRKIRVNVVSPGVVPSPAYKNALGLNDQQIEDFVAGAIPNIPLGRVGGLDEVAKTVVFLAPDDSSFVNAIELFVDGGHAQI